SQRHALVIANAYTPERASEMSELEDSLVVAARTHTPQELGRLVRYVTDAIDGDGGAATDEQRYERRGYHLSRTLDGMLATNGTYDPEAGEIHAAALAAEMERDLQDHDSRTPAQRRADAHTNLMRQSLDRGDLGTTRNARPHVTVVVDLDELPGTSPDLVAHVRAERRRDGHLSAVTLERLTCDCDISRVITAGRSEVLDVGRATRTIPPAIWKALVVRDGHCQAPGCDQGPDRCEGHHVVHWTRGGPTNLANLQLLCWQHHRHRHNHDAQARAA
ncbi:MAG: hypothetical protein QOH28_4118, partial [Actinomycetota bacterium]|nr:hypothetical protein [Actinomycetota bacterium]